MALEIERTPAKKKKTKAPNKPAKSSPKVKAPKITKDDDKTPQEIMDNIPADLHISTVKITSAMKGKLVGVDSNGSKWGLLIETPRSLDMHALCGLVKATELKYISAIIIEDMYTTYEVVLQELDVE